MSDKVVVRIWKKLLYTSGNFLPPLYIAVEETTDGFFRARWHDESRKDGRTGDWGLWGSRDEITAMCGGFVNASPDWEKSNILLPPQDRFIDLLIED